MTKHIGVFAGTFDPIHKGHISFALQAMTECRLDRVLIVPEPTPRHKVNVTSLEERNAVIDEMIAELPTLKRVSAQSYRHTFSSINTVLEQLYSHAHCSLLIGSDVVYSLQNWKDLEQIIRKYSFIIGMRACDDESSVRDELAQIRHHVGFDVHLTFINAPYANVSSSQIRSLKSS